MPEDAQHCTSKLQCSTVAAVTCMHVKSVLPTPIVKLTLRMTSLHAGVQSGGFRDLCQAHNH